MIGGPFVNYVSTYLTIFDQLSTPICLRSLRTGTLFLKASIAQQYFHYSLNLSTYTVNTVHFLNSSRLFSFSGLSWLGALHSTFTSRNTWRKRRSFEQISKQNEIFWTWTRKQGNNILRWARTSKNAWLYDVALAWTGRNHTVDRRASGTPAKIKLSSIGNYVYNTVK